MRRWAHSVASASLRTWVRRVPNRCVSSIRGISSQERRHLHQRADQVFNFQWKIFDRYKYPGSCPRRNPRPWIVLLDAALPPHLRISGDNRPATCIDAEGIAEILLAAQHVGTTQRTRKISAKSSVNLDLLEYVALKQGRWSAVIYLVKQLVDAYAGLLQPRRIQLPAYKIDTRSSLRDLTGNGPIDLASKAKPVQIDADSLHLDDQTQQSSDGHDGFSFDTLFARAALGQVWRSLGRIVVSCVEDGVPPEALEIIAYLHHRGVMPTSIYNNKPSSDPTAIQQPPLLYMFSSRILASLSDAAWRAHEKLVVEESKAKGGAYSSMRPEIPGMAYRVRVASLRPEVWLELILWSCLHGGWVLEGLDVIIGICKETRGEPWKPLSWRSMMSGEAGEAQDWDTLHQRLTADNRAMFDVRKTISAEVVNAYIDALLNLLHVKPERRGITVAKAVYRLSTMRLFLWKGGLNNFAGASWDVALARLFESQGEEFYHSPRGLITLAKLSAPFGHEFANDDADYQPPYVLARSSATLGIYHRALRANIAAGDLGMALSVLYRLIEFTDRNKNRAFVSFDQKLEVDSSEPGLFQQNHPPIEYPAFDAQIPPGTLASFMELVLSSKRYDVGESLLANHPLAGAIIPHRLFRNPALLAVLLRFAVETDNQPLLSDLLAREARLKRSRVSLVAQTFLQVQIRARNWMAAQRVLVYIRDDRGLQWDIRSLVVLAQIMITSKGKALEQSQELFRSMVQGVYDPKTRSQQLDSQVSTLLVIMASVSRQWADFATSLQPLATWVKFELGIQDFHLILEAVVTTYGSREARNLIDRFWYPELRLAQRRQHSARRRPQPLDSVEMQHKKMFAAQDSAVGTIVYGGPAINKLQIEIVFDQFVNELRRAHPDSRKGISEELSEAVKAYTTELFQKGLADADAHMSNDTSSFGMINWVIRMFGELGERKRHISRASRRGLLSAEIDALQPYLNAREDFEKQNSERGRVRCHVTDH